MSKPYRVILAATLACCVSAAFADGIEPGLWRITSRVETNGVLGPPQVSNKCLTPEQTRDLAKTFSPVMGTVNSECAPIERSLVGTKLSWKLVCKGQLDMELTGDFEFDTPRHYSAKMHTKSAMGGNPLVDLRHTLDAERVSDCQ